ncbi:SulP family inorganic anion transporter [Paenibacillus thalictri]|uniref:Sulfate permease n=1 Tax=Paenibacillus thalictri TaxID=2527873 RepID=A0A4Q9DHN3_9BACL|nr:sulfate permease [Paenibacillus thalictri]TBL71446.1 sulfate permease [Paenibacillus thalictri]
MRWHGRFAGYTVSALRRDLVSGLIVGIVAIPLAMAFAIASGVKPQFGIYTTIVAGILISLLGGSKFQIGGPTGAFIPILLGVVLQYGYENLLIAGMMAGILLVLMGVFRLGVLIRFIPRPVTIGFTAGIAVIIFSGQIANFLGLQGLKSHEDFLSNMKEIATHLSSLNVYSIATALTSLAVLLTLPKIWPKIPASLIGLLLSSIVAAVFFDGKVATIGSAYGDIPSTLPAFALPHISWDKITQLLQPALVIAMLGGIESLLSAVVADGMSGTKHNSNKELIGQGIANVVTPLFGGIPATGAIARTATNIRTGAASPFSGIIHGAVVLLVLVLFARYASAIPLAGMAPILMVVAWNMSERKHFKHILQTKSADSLVLVITFLLTVLTNLTTAVEVGLALSVIIFVKRMSEIVTVSKVLPERGTRTEKVRAHTVKEGHDCPQIGIFTMEGPLFFGAPDLIESRILETMRSRPKTIVLRMGKVPFIDATGEAILSNIVERIALDGAAVLISGIQPQPRAYLEKSGFVQKLGAESFFDHTGEAIGYAMNRLDLDRCRGCSHYAFRECAALASPPVQENGLGRSAAR